MGSLSTQSHGAMSGHAHSSRFLSLMSARKCLTGPTAAVKGREVVCNRVSGLRRKEYECTEEGWSGSLTRTHARTDTHRLAHTPQHIHTPTQTPPEGKISPFSFSDSTRMGVSQIFSSACLKRLALVSVTRSCRLVSVKANWFQARWRVGLIGKGSRPQICARIPRGELRLSCLDTTQTNLAPFLLDTEGRARSLDVIK